MIQISKDVKGLIFDLDGTVANTMQNHFSAWRKAVMPYGINFSGELFKKLTGMPKIATIEKLNELYGTRMDALKVAEAKAAYYKDLAPQTEEIKVVADVIRKYYGQLPMAIGTGSSRFGANRTLATIKMKKYFDVLVTADDIIHPKPHPETFLRCAELIGILPEHCIVFEDGILGMKAAEAAGMRVVDVNKYFKMEFEM